MSVKSLPIWLQAMAVMLIAGVFLATAVWACWQVEHAIGGDPNRWNRFFRDPTFDYLCLAIPMAVIWLGVRFLWQMVNVEERGWNELIVCLMVIVFLLPSLLAIGLWFVPPSPQWVRGGSWV